jgi:hypothetical protein
MSVAPLMPLLIILQIFIALCWIRLGSILRLLQRRWPDIAEDPKQ